MKYRLDDLLEEETAQRLTEEALGMTRAGNGRGWKRAAALAACTAVLLGAVNFDAIAAGAAEIFRYIAGVGVAAPEGEVLILEEPVSATKGSRTYQVSWACQQGGYVDLAVEVLSQGEEPEAVSAVLAELWEGENKLTAYEYSPEDGGESTWSVTPFNDPERYAEEWAQYGYSLPARFRERSALAFHAQTFEAGGGSYSLKIYEDGNGDGPALVMPLELKDSAERLAVKKTRFKLEEGSVTAFTSKDGKRFFLELDMEGVARLLPMDVYFVDSQGVRWPAAVPPAMSWHQKSVEIVPAEEPAAEIKSIEIGGVFFNTGDPFRWTEYRELGWVIILE